MKLSIFLIYVMITSSLISQQITAQRADSIYKSYTIDDIFKYKKTLDKKIEENKQKRVKLSAVGLNVNKNILESNSSIGANQDIMLLRLAEFFIDEEDKNYFADYDTYTELVEPYAKALEAFEEDSIKNPRPLELLEPVKSYKKPIELYNRILAEFANGDMVDDAMYNKAFLLNEEGKGEESRAVYQELIDKFPESQYTPNAIIALADHFFESDEFKGEDERIEDLNKAILLYKRVLKYKESVKYSEALYKLGWSYYRMAARDDRMYKDCVAYFTLVLDDISVAEKMKKGTQYSNPDIKGEAVDYIGVAFSAEDNVRGGVKNMRKFVEKLLTLKKPYASLVMKSLGDLYFKLRQDSLTIIAYSDMQDLFPYHPDAAETQSRIVDAYRHFDKDIDYLSESKSFPERYKLFTKFNSKSQWYSEVLKSTEIENKFEVLNKAEKNAEQALLKNIVGIYGDINVKEQKGGRPVDDYLQLEKMCEDYLKFFPNFDNAFKVHRSYAEILDARLKKYEKAYEEYIAASNIYPNELLKNRIDVAYNAVVTADTLRSAAGDKNYKFKFSSNDSNKAIPLSTSEKRLVDAYQNYLRIAENDSNSANFLFNLSAIYFNRRQFNEANRYSKTLLKRFPGAKGEALARIRIMNGYYANGQYLSAEAMAKKIIKDKISDADHIKEAKERLFDCILSNAAFYEKQGKHYLSGTEYKRAVLDAPYEARPNYKFIALYNAGQEFNKANDNEEAIESYNMIVKEKDKFNIYTRKSMLNMAFAYKDLKQFKTAAEFFEKIYFEYPDSADSKTFLYNAGALYESAKSWKDAIRVNEYYARTFSTEEVSKDLLFINASYYLKLDDFDSANEIYNEFSSKYPNDSRVIEAFYRRGKYFLDKKDITRAKPELQNAVTRNEQFRKEKKQFDDYYAAEAAYEIIQMDERDFRTISFKWPTSNIEKMRKLQQERLIVLKDNYTKLMVYGSPRSLVAPYKIAELYENVSSVYSEQETDPNEKDQAKNIAATSKIRATGAELYKETINQFKSAMKDISKIAKKFNIDLNDTIAKAQEEEKTGGIKRAQTINIDSLKNIAISHINKSKEKITSLVFLIAKQSEENIKNVLNFRTDYDGKVNQEGLMLAAREIILDKRVVLEVDKSVNAHKVNIQTALDLKVENKYTEESKRRIVINNNITANEFNKLSLQALKFFNEYYVEFVYLIGKKFETKSKKYTKKVYGDLNPELENFLELATNYNNKALNAFKNTIENARKDSIFNDLTEYTELSILNGPLDYASALQAIQDSLTRKRDYFVKKFNSLPDDDEIKFNYEDGKTALDDILFTIKDNIVAALDESFKLAKTLSLPKTPSYNKILKKLITIDAATYATEIPKEEINVVSDTSWTVAKNNPDLQTLNDYTYDDSSWKKSVYLDNDSNKSVALDTLKPLAHAIWYPDQMISKQVEDKNTITNIPLFYTDSVSKKKVYYSLDSLNNKISLETDTLTGYPLNFSPKYAIKTIQTSVDSADTAKVYFRKKFNLPGRLFSGKFLATGDGVTSIFINGTFIKDLENISYANPDSANQVLFNESIKIGENIVSIWTVDTNLPRKGTRFNFRLFVLPKEFTNNGDTVIDESVQLEATQAKEIQTFIKNRLLINSNATKIENQENDLNNTPKDKEKTTDGQTPTNQN